MNNKPTRPALLHLLHFGSVLFFLQSILLYCTVMPSIHGECTSLLLPIFRDM